MGKESSTELSNELLRQCILLRFINKKILHKFKAWFIESFSVLKCGINVSGNIDFEFYTRKTIGKIYWD